MRGVLILLLLAAGAGLIYVGYSGNVPGQAATASTQNPFAGVGRQPSTIAQTISDIIGVGTNLQTQVGAPWAVTAASGVTGGLHPSGTQAGGTAR